MTSDHTAAPVAPHPDGNNVDASYLEDAVAALVSIMRVSKAAAHRSDQRDIRALASDALSAQTAQLATISACLRDRGYPLDQPPGPIPGATPATAPMHGAARDRSFVEQLTAHAHDSIAAARIEMIAGSSHAVRPIAESAIHDEERQLAALVVHARLRSARS